MRSINTLALAAALVIFAQNLSAQETQTEEKEREQKELITKAEEELERSKRGQIALLMDRRERVKEEWKLTLKSRIQAINSLKDSDKWDLSDKEVERRKQQAAEEIALNIENELAIIDNQIALVERTGFIQPGSPSQLEIGIGARDKDGNRTFGVAVKNNKPVKIEYDRRTYGETVFAYGLNNAISDNAEIGDDFSIGRSTFFEWGYAWKTRVFKDSGALQFKYGLSLQTNIHSIKDNRIFSVTEGLTSFEEFPFDLKKARIRTTNLVAPLHFEFGGWKKEEKEDYVRYRLAGKFRMGIGGYVGVRLGTQQKLKYRADGERIKSKSRQDFGGDDFVFGLSSYIRVTGDLSLYGKYDLSSAFKTTELGEVNNVSLGLRLDL